MTNSLASIDALRTHRRHLTESAQRLRELKPKMDVPTAIRATETVRNLEAQIVDLDLIILEAK